MKRIFALICVGLLATIAKADIIDLTTAGSADLFQGAIYAQVAPQPTGSGVIHSFVRIQNNGTEQGYNTSGRPLQFDENNLPTFTHGVSFASIQTVTIGQTPCFLFLLDANQQNNTPNNLLSMTAFQIYAGDSDSLVGTFTPGVGFSGGHSTGPLFDLGLNNQVLMDAGLNPGSGVGDMAVAIPVALLSHDNGLFPFLYLYSRFGPPPVGASQSNAGFEEWANADVNVGVPTLFQQPPGVPTPPALVLGLIGVVGLVGRRVMTKRKEVTLAA